MGLEAGQYNMQCWNSTVNPDNMNHSRRLFQCFQLIRDMQKRFTNGEIAIPSTDSKPTRKGVEICILYRAGTNLFTDIADFLTKTAASKGFDYRNFAKQEAGITRYFSQEEIENVSVLGKPVPDNLTEESIAKTIDQAKEFAGFRMNDSWRNGIPAEQRAPPFQIPRTVFKKLCDKEGNNLAAEIRAVMDAIATQNKELKTSTSIITMLAKGAAWLMSVGLVSAEINGSVFCVLVLWNLGFTAAAVATGGILVGVLAALLGGAYLMLKDATNVLLVINDTQNDIMPKMEWIQNGERRVVPEMIPAAVPNGDFVSCGLFIYSKYQVKSFSIGSYGSAFGVSFDAGNGHFSIGMDCPNSLAGGNNSIEVHNQEHAQQACKKALDSGCMHGWTDQPRVDVKIADHWGNVNWGRAVVMRS